MATICTACMNVNKLRVFMKIAFVPFVQPSEETTIIFYTTLINLHLLAERGRTACCEEKTKVFSIRLMKFPLQAVSLRLLNLDVQVPFLERSWEIYGGLSGISTVLIFHKTNFLPLKNEGIQFSEVRFLRHITKWC